MEFEEFWAIGIKNLKNRISDSDNGKRYIIHNWRADSGAIDQEIPLVEADPRKIDCLSIHASKRISIPKSDMKTLYGLWEDYINGRITRMEIVEKIRRPTYCVSLMKHMMENI